MSFSRDRLARAQEQSQASREELLATIAEIRSRVSPARLVTKARDQLTERGEMLSRKSLATIRRHPGISAGAAIGTALLTIVVPLLRRRRRKRGDETAAGTTSFRTKRAAARAARRARKSR